MDKYLIQEKIGEGLLGEVFMAIQLETKQKVAIKIIHLDQPPEDLEDVQKELNFLKSCDSQHITKYYETILKDETLYLVMEYMSPGSLKDYLTKIGPIAEMYISMILREMLLGLEYLQSERRCHRNLKASNVLLSEKGEVKLSDLVVGGSLGDATRLESVARAPYWIAPEVMSGNPKLEKLDKQDVWSIGITAYEIATGVTPYHVHEPMKMNLLLAREDAPRLEGEFSRSFKDFVNLCLSKEVKKRPTIKELLTHPFIRKSKKISNLLDMVGKLSRQHRPSQRIEMSTVGTVASSHTPQRNRSFSTTSLSERLRSADTGSDESGNELGGSLSFGSPTTASPQSSSTVSDPSSGTTKIGVAMSRLRNTMHDSSKFTSITTNISPSPSPTPTTAVTNPTAPTSIRNSNAITTSTAATNTSSSIATITPATTTPTNSAFTPTNPSSPVFSPTITAITTDVASALKNDGDAPKTHIDKRPGESKSAATASVPSEVTPSPTANSNTNTNNNNNNKNNSNSTTVVTSSPTSSTTPIVIRTPSTDSSNTTTAPPVVTSNLPTLSNTSPVLVSSASNDTINESDFQSFVSPVSPPVTPKVKLPLLTTPPTSSFLDSVILPVLAKKGRAPSEETQIVLNELKDSFKRLEASQQGASQQLLNDWVEAVLWENYSQQERGSPMANYLLLRWKNGTPL